MKGLNLRQQVFAMHYLKCLNGSEAARKAGYKNRANTIAYQLMHCRPLVRVYIQQQVAKMSKDVELSFEYKIERLKHLVRLGIPIDSSSIDKDLARLALQAISESNKMQGHLAAEKREVKVTSDDQQLIAAHELKEKYKSDL